MDREPDFMVYVAGPFRGASPLDVRRNVERARDAGFEVAQCGAIPYIPHTMYADFDKQLTDEYWINATEEGLRRCDGILLLEGWRESEGSKSEANVAWDIGLPIFYDVANLKAYMEQRDGTEETEGIQGAG